MGYFDARYEYLGISFHDAVKLLGVTLDSGSDDGPARCCHDDRPQ